MPAQIPTYEDLADDIAGFMTRTRAAFIINGKDKLLRAINNSKNFAQRALLFEYARVFVKVPAVSLANGGNLNTAVLNGTTTPVSIKTIEHAFLNFTNGSGQFPISIISRDAHIARQYKKYQDVITTMPESQQPPSSLYPFSLVQYGKIIYILPANNTAFNNATTVDVFLDAVEWMPDVIANTDGKYRSLRDNQDFLLENCYDFLLFRSIYELNFYLKEDQRVAISTKQLDEVWENIKAWNNTVVGNVTDDANLD